MSVPNAEKLSFAKSMQDTRCQKNRQCDLRPAIAQEAIEEKMWPLSLEKYTTLVFSTSAQDWLCYTGIEHVASTVQLLCSTYDFSNEETFT